MLYQSPNDIGELSGRLVGEASRPLALDYGRLASRPRSAVWSKRLWRRALVLMAGDLLVINAMMIWRGRSGAFLHLSWGVAWHEAFTCGALSALGLVIGRMLGIYDVEGAARAPQALGRVWLTGIVVWGLQVLIPKFATGPSPSIREAAAMLLWLLGGEGFWRVMFARAFAHPGSYRRALIVGAGWAGRTLAEAMSGIGNAEGNAIIAKGYEVLGFIDDDVLKREALIAGVPVLGNSESLVKVVRTLQPDDLILAITDTRSLKTEMFQAILDCRELGVAIISMHALYEQLTQQVPVEHSGANFGVVMPLTPPKSLRLYWLFREGAEMLSTVLGVGLMGLVIPIVWAANRLTSPGPLFYRQERVGQSGKPFMMLKFRSMVVEAERDTGGVWAKNNDDRITPVGRFLRKSRLDELPQVWNVLRGEMSLIGPRPERPCFIERLAKEIPYYRLRNSVKPGLTGWAQVQYRYGASVNDALIKLRYDFYYIKHHSILLDLKILVKTLSLVLNLKGR